MIFIPIYPKLFVSNIKKISETAFTSEDPSSGGGRTLTGKPVSESKKKL